MIKRLTLRERQAVQDWCRICGELKLCDRGQKGYLERTGQREEDLHPAYSDPNRKRPEGRICIECRKKAAKMYAREKGLNLRKSNSIHWFSNRGDRHEGFPANVNAGMPLFHQLPKELHPQAHAMLKQRMSRYRERHGKRPDIRAKYLLVANVIRSIRSPNGPLHRNYMHEKKALRAQVAGYFRAQSRRRGIVRIPPEHRSGMAMMEGI